MRQLARRLAVALAAAAAIYLAISTPALAQQPQGFHLEITPTAGWRTGGEVEASDLFDEDVEIDDSETFGLVVEIPLLHWVQIELLANRQRSALRSDSGLFVGDRELADVTVENYQAGMLFQYGGGQVLPFLTMTLGLARIDPDVAGASPESRFAGTFGGGVKVFFSRNIGMRFEGRGYWADFGDDDCNSYDCYYYYDDGLYQFEGSVGLIIAF
jgi:hypothetical protein